MRFHQCLIVALVIGCTVFQDASSVARVTRSSDESLRDPGTYIIYFKKSATDTEIRKFAAMIKASKDFTAEIISEFLSIKSLSARLSEQALTWVRVFSCLRVTVFSFTNIKH